MDIAIPGWNQTEVNNLDTTPKTGGFQTFPCRADKYVKHTAKVMKAELKTNESSGQTQILLTVANGQYGDSIWIDTDPRNVPPGTQDVAKAMQANLDRLKMVVKILGCATARGFDTGKLERSNGQCVQISVKHSGFREYQGKSYHKTKCYLDGQVTELLPVDEAIGWPHLPGGGGSGGDVPWPSEPVGASKPFSPDIF